MTMSRRALNRATLDRQLLLRRARLPVSDAIEQLVGVQAQAPNAPYVALWSRLNGFRHETLAGLLIDRAVVRAPLMRATVHLVTAADVRELSSLTAPVLARAFAGVYGRRVAEADLDSVLAIGRDCLAERPRTRVELRALLAERWPDGDSDALSYAVTYLLPVVQTTPRGVWGTSSPATWTTIEQWLGTQLDARACLDRGLAPDRFILRYLAAFGPATVKDMQVWSGLTRLAEVVERLPLRTVRDEDGRALWDLPDAPRPDPETPAPPRFLAEYDNLLLSHDDRSRVLPNGRRTPLFSGNGGRLGTVLVDGFLAGTWKIALAGEAATLTITPYAPIPREHRDAVLAEGARLLDFAAADATTRDVRL
jgi:hypothetical protein